MTHANDNLDVGHDLEFTKITRQAAGAGTWICGTMSEHRFDALVFPEHAADPEWEIGDSRISKLWVQRLADRSAMVRQYCHIVNLADWLCDLQRTRQISR